MSDTQAQTSAIWGQIRAVEAQLAQLRQQYQQAVNSGNQPLAEVLLGQIQSTSQQLISLRAQAQQLETQQSRETVSSGSVIAQDQQARGDDANTQNPPAENQVLAPDGRLTTRPDTTTATNAVAFDPATINDFGTDAELRPLIQTQATAQGNTNQGGAPLTDPTVDGRPVAGGQNPGVGSGNDDSGGSTNSTRTEIDNAFGGSKITPQPNVLDQYASYTYVASVYLMSPEDYKRMIQTKQKVIGSAQLLFQSGGASIIGRNEFFTDDYYIDSIQLKSVITGKGTNAAHNVTNISMTVVEPNGISLINNLDRAVQQYLGTAGEKKKNFQAQLYLLVIKFYGYDDQGNLVRGGVPKPDGSSDPNAFIEKWYPMSINNITFKVSNKLVEYSIDASGIQTSIAAGSSRGTIPYNVELSGVTVSDALNGPPQYVTPEQIRSSATTGGVATQASVRAIDNALAAQEATGTNSTTGQSNEQSSPVNTGPAKANAAPKKNSTVRQGLMAALNEYQQQLVRDGTYTYADVYSVEFVNSSIEQAKVKSPGSTDKTKVPMNTGNNPSGKLPNKQSADTSGEILAITAGTQIVSAIDKIVRNSTYIQDQQLVIFDPTTQKEIPNGAAGKNLAWFKISLQASPIAYDPKRNDWAYNIKYVVSFYKITDSISPYFFIPTYNGVHKQYNYWFTGENIAVLNYEQTFNSQYTSVLSGGNASAASIINESIKQNFQPRSDESSQGADGKVNEPAANLADWLYNPSDLANATLTIVGDPGWLQQGEAFAGMYKTDPAFFSPFLADGTINFDSQQVLFEILINMPKDYDLETGLINPNSQNQIFRNGSAVPGAARQSYVYRANECISEFVKGKFTQTLKGTLNSYLPDQTFKANQVISQDLSTDVLRNLSRQRLGGTTGTLNNASALSTLLNTLPGAGGLRLSPQQAALFSGSILGGQQLRTSPYPLDPTSFALQVGLASLNTGAPRAGTVIPTVEGPEAGTVPGNPEGVIQVMAANDDAAIFNPPTDLGDFYG